MIKNKDTALALGAWTWTTAGAWFYSNALGLLALFSGLVLQYYFLKRRDDREVREQQMKEKDHEKNQHI